jgi:hypothetical protein
MLSDFVQGLTIAPITVSIDRAAMDRIVHPRSFVLAGHERVR